MAAAELARQASDKVDVSELLLPPAMGCLAEMEGAIITRLAIEKRPLLTWDFSLIPRLL